MGKIDSNQYTLKEFQSHLATMKETLNKDKSLTPDFFDGFIEFFNNEINNFNTSIPANKKITPLDNNLSHLDETIQQVAASQIQPEKAETKKLSVIVPRLGDKITPSTMANRYKEGNIKAGLEMLENAYDIYPIKGDGHCLYRTILGQILLQCPKLSDEDYTNFLYKQVTFIDENKELEKDYSILKNYLDEIRQLPLEQQEKRFQEIMLDAKNSDKLVEYLRKLCQKHHLENWNEVNEGEFELSSGSVDKYLEDLVCMKGKIALGGHPEIAALTDILGVRMHVLNCDTIGQGEDHHLGYNYHGNVNSPVTFPLLFRPGHYDMAVAK